MCNVKYIICVTFCMCTCCHAVATCSDSSTNKFSYKVIETFDYCWDKNIVFADTNSTDTALFISFHKYIISPIFNAFCNNENKQAELDKIRYCCKHSHINAQKRTKNNIQHYSIEINIFSNIKNYAPITLIMEELKKHDYSIVDVISESPIMCLVFMEADCLIAVTYNMFYDFDDVLSISKCFVQDTSLQENRCITHSTER